MIKSRENIFFRHLNRASTWCIAHYAQEISNLKFEQFQSTILEKPEEYDLDGIDSSKIALFYSDKDVLQTKKSINRLKDDLESNDRKLLDYYKIPCSGWTHMDYIKAKDAGKCMNARILQLLAKSN